MLNMALRIESIPLHEVLRDPKKLRKFFEMLVPLHVFIDISDHNILCPFHPDSAPSARVYRDEDEVERLWCYSCGRHFTAFDYVSKVRGEQPIRYLASNFTKEELDIRSTGVEWNAPEAKRSFDYDDYAHLLPDTAAFLNAAYYHVQR